MRILGFVVLLLLSACAHHKWPAALPDATYPNGHPIVVNTVDPLVAGLEDDLIAITNQEREKLGLPALLRNEALCGLARGHSMHMSVHTFYDHKNPEGDGPGQRVTRVVRHVPFHVYENIWMVVEPVDAQFIFNGFWNSPSHKEAILSNTRYIGVGMYRATIGSYTWIWVSMEFLL